MNKLTLNSVLTSSLALIITQNATAMDQHLTGKEKCYGIVKAGKNDCAAKSGSHSCAGQAKVDYDPNEWKWVAKGTCVKMKGMQASESAANAEQDKKPNR